MTTVGIDVSNNNALPDITNNDFVISKATEGGSFVDRTYASRHSYVASLGKMWGAYHFFRTGVSVNAQVAFFLQTANLSPGDFVALDFEDDGTWSTFSPQTLASMAHQFMTALQNRIPQHRAVLYCNQSTYAGIIQPNGVNIADGLWIAAPGVQPPMPWVIWQYGTDVVDQDYGNFASFGDMQQWVTTAGQGSPTPTPQPPATVIGEMEAMPLGEWPAGGNQEHVIVWPTGSGISLLTRAAWFSMCTGGANAVAHGHIYYVSTQNGQPAYLGDEDFTLMQDVRWYKQLPDLTDHVTVFLRDATNTVGWCLEIQAL